MTKLNIGLDLDQTMVHFTIMEYISKRMGLNYKSEDVGTIDFSEFPDNVRDELYKVFQEPKFYEDLELFPGTKEKLLQWKNDGHNLFIITHRPPILEEATEKCLSKYFPKDFFEKIIFSDYNNPDNSKLKHMKDLKLDVWIDDNPNDLVCAMQNNIYTYIMTNKYTKYNFIINWTEKYDMAKRVEYIKDIELGV